MVEKDHAAQIGDMFFVLPDDPYLYRRDDGRHAYHGYRLSNHYVRNWAAKRPPLVVLLPWSSNPGRAIWFVVDSEMTDNAEGWTVTGEPPQITVTPSIHLVGIWHGFLTNGVLS